MKHVKQLVAAFLLTLSAALPLLAQVENVPTYHPVYIFLKRMDVKGIIDRYRDAVLPLSRGEVGQYLTEIESKMDRLTDVEKEWLADYLSEFQYDIKGTTNGFHSLFSSEQSTFGGALGQELSGREKYFYFSADSVTSFFFNGLATVDGRGISGDALGKTRAEYFQFGGRFRGTVEGHLGYYLQGTNALFWGSRALLQRDPLLAQSHALYVTDTKSFDFSQGYVRYSHGIISAQVGRERVLWGYGTDQQMIISDNAREFDFIRLDAQYKAIKYTFLHAWLLGSQSNLTFTLPFDTSTKFIEPVIADKYLAAHRFSISFPSLFELGFQEMYIYSNRSPDLAYLNPLILFESAQRSRGERDNGLWAFDIKTHFLNGLQLHGTLLYDDIHIPYLFSGRWFDRYAYQVGMVYADPFMIHNTTLFVEYTYVKPYVFAHDRSRDDSYTSLGMILGPRIGPNADSWFFRWDWLPLRNLFLSARVSLDRKGQNVYDSTGTLSRNVGGDFLVPHRPTDPDIVHFLDGVLVKSQNIQFLVTYEFINQMWLDALFQFDELNNTVTGVRTMNRTVVVRVRTEL